MELPAGLIITGALVARDDGFAVGRFTTAPALDDVCMAEEDAASASASAAADEALPPARSGLASRRYRFPVPGFLVGFSDGFVVGRQVGFGDGVRVGVLVGDTVVGFAVGMYVGDAVGFAVEGEVGLGVGFLEVGNAEGDFVDEVFVTALHTYIHIYYS